VEPVLQNLYHSAHENVHFDCKNAFAIQRLKFAVILFAGENVEGTFLIYNKIKL
jgi:hypothetical protein